MKNSRNNCQQCAVILSGNSCPYARIAQIESDYPHIEFQHMDTESCSSDELCAYRDLYLVIRPEDILGIEDCWLENSPLISGLSLNQRRIYIARESNENLCPPDWSRFFASLTDRGADIIHLSVS